MYKLIRNFMSDRVTQQIISDSTSVVFRDVDNTSIPFNPDNTDYVRFKKEILADEAQLKDAEGNTMTPEQAKTYVATLP
jgi:hypothetical protein